MPASTLLVGFVAGMFGFALLSQGLEDEEVEVLGSVEDEEEEPEINDYNEKGRRVKMFCQRCRKQQPHRETKRNLYQCNRCKNATDLR
jgi:hypothetical protein